MPNNPFTGRGRVIVSYAPPDGHAPVQWMFGGPHSVMGIPLLLLFPLHNDLCFGLPGEMEANQLGFLYA